eukprot:3934910-Rhodomonas_salina.1
MSHYQAVTVVSLTPFLRVDSTRVGIPTGTRVPTGRVLTLTESLLPRTDSQEESGVMIMIGKAPGYPVLTPGTCTGVTVPGYP